MKNRRNLYFLIPAVLLIWGLIIYRIVYFSSGDDTGEIRYNSPGHLKIEPVSDDLYQPTFTYPDPFLKRLQVDNPSDRLPTVGDSFTEQEEPEKEKDLVTYDLKYKGYVTPTGKTFRVALLQVEGKEIFLKQGESHESFLLQRIFEDSVLLLTNSRKWVVKKE